MKAAIWTAYGPPEVLEVHEIPTPKPKPDQVLVKIAASNVFPGDCELRGFDLHALFWLPLRVYIGILKPRRVSILGQEFAGEVVDVGSAVTGFDVGDRVVAPTGMGGTYAEFIAQKPDLIVKIPDAVSYEDACSLSVGGLNALHFLEVGNVGEGQHVLLFGAGGSIGTMAIQLAKLKGAEITVVEHPDKLDVLKSVGADHVIEYTTEDFTQNGQVHDVIVDFPGKSPFRRSLTSLKPGGYYVHGNGSTATMIRRTWASRLSGRNVRIALAGYEREDLEYLVQLMAEGKLKAVIDKRYSLEQIVEAHRYVETGAKTGNVILEIGDSLLF
jgi:NADPH:quinone reductase-like Zn-dependent oxidoreductase